MKKKSLLLTCAALLAVMIMLLCGCSSYGGIKASYENAGFTESELTEAIQSDLMKAIKVGSEEEIEQVCTIHVFTKDIVNIAVILEFNSTDDMQEMIDGSDTLKALIKDIQNSDYVNGNCLLALAILDAKAPFKG